jgi:uncharacterized membrane protein
MVYNIMKYRVSGLCPSSGILITNSDMYVSFRIFSFFLYLFVIYLTTLTVSQIYSVQWWGVSE